MTSFYQQILSASVVTVGVSVLAMIMGIAIAVFMAVVILSGSSFRYLIKLYGALFRSLPDVLIIFGIHYSIQYLAANYFHFYNVSAFVSGCVALGLIVSAFFCPIIIYAYHALDGEQLLVCQSLQLPTLTVVFSIMVPQILSKSFPMMISLFLVILKDSSVVSLIGLNDVMNASHIAASATFSPMRYYGLAAIIYLLLTAITMILQKSNNNLFCA